MKKKETRRKAATASQKNGKAVVIVESPAKARTINKILGHGYVVKACQGHVRDLPKHAFGVDVDHDFAPTYKVIRDKAKVLADLRKVTRHASAVYLAPDPDREGEAIAWHLVEALNIPQEKTKRVTFNEITKKGVLDAFQRPGQISMDRVYAQQARRLLDRIVGYKLSPLLWEKIARQLSAGRVQSVAVRLIVEREQEIRAFKAEEYWTITAHLSKKDDAAVFRAELAKLDGQEAKVPNGSEANALVEELSRAPFVVENVAQREKVENAPPPFTTSLLQQQASIKLRFSTRKTMSVAQQLYEGIDLAEEGSVGLITYMRTDSFRVADEAVAECRSYIEKKFGAPYLPDKPPVRRARKGAQEAHEAIRPTSAERTPESIRSYLTEEQYRLYRLIWRRFVASQMKPAVYLTTDASIRAGRATFVAKGRQLVFDGYTRLASPWARREDVVELLKEHGTVAAVLAHVKRGGLRLTPEAADHLRDQAQHEGVSPELQQALAAVRDQVLPPLAPAEELRLRKLDPGQHFTEPPPRYTEASLVKTLERYGIGRPSTYAPIISTIQDRGYVTLEARQLKPTQLGELVTEKLVKHFNDIMNTGFTAKMEKKLDQIEEGRVKWVDVLRRFYGVFIGDLDKARTEMTSVKGLQPETPVPCEKCGRPMLVKWNRFGQFLACSGYPECKSIKSLQPPEAVGEKCEKCGADMVIKSGRFGRFLACSKYPECKNTRPLPRGNRRLAVPPGWEQKCEKCASAMVVRYGRRGPFIACSGYPNCTNTMRVPKEWYQTVKPAGTETAPAESDAAGDDASPE
ncbi:MAG: type I DNA topoisomerase [Planctomycetes bacterium]|nr:type I DNA topoisomerase [Planctomycetota bacterium]